MDHPGSYCTVYSTCAEHNVSTDNSPTVYTNVQHFCIDETKNVAVVIINISGTDCCVYGTDAVLCYL